MINQTNSLPQTLSPNPNHHKFNQTNGRMSPKKNNFKKKTTIYFNNLKLPNIRGEN